jgi:hypothetical protein
MKQNFIYGEGDEQKKSARREHLLKKGQIRPN